MKDFNSMPEKDHCSDNNVDQSFWEMYKEDTYDDLGWFVGKKK